MEDRKGWNPCELWCEDFLSIYTHWKRTGISWKITTGKWKLERYDYNTRFFNNAIIEIDVWRDLLWIWWKTSPTGQWTNWSGVTGKTAIIYMKEFQLKVTETSFEPLNKWHWYVDDSEIKCMNEEVQQILDHFNNIESGVTAFTKKLPRRCFTGLRFWNWE